MILSFNIEYRTNWGEEVRISGLFPRESYSFSTPPMVSIGRQNLSLKFLQEGNDHQL